MGIKNGDSEADARYLAEKCINLRIFADNQNKFNLSALDIQGEILVVSQFTLYGDTRKGRRPSFVDAALPEIEEPFYEKFMEHIRDHGLKVGCGEFGAMMDVDLVNSGPVTVILDSHV